MKRIVCTLCGKELTRDEIDQHLDDSERYWCDKCVGETRAVSPCKVEEPMEEEKDEKGKRKSKR